MVWFDVRPVGRLYGNKTLTDFIRVELMKISQFATIVICVDMKVMLVVVVVIYLAGKSRMNFMRWQVQVIVIMKILFVMSIWNIIITARIARYIIIKMMVNARVVENGKYVQGISTEITKNI